MLSLAMFLIACEGGDLAFQDETIPVNRCHDLIQSVGLQEAYDTCLQDANKGIMQAQIALAQSLENSDVKTAQDQAHEWYKKALQHNQPQAYVVLADFYFRSGKPTYGVETLMKGMQEGHASVKNKLAILYLEGKYVKYSPHKAERLLRDAAADSNSEANYQLAMLYKRQDYRNDKLSRQYLEQAAEQNHKLALEAMGLSALEQGNIHQAATWFAKAAQLHSAVGQYWLAKLQLENKLPWHLDAHALLTRSIDYPPSMVLMAKQLRLNEATEKQNQVAKNLLFKAAKKGEAEAMYLIGLDVLNGEYGTSYDSDTAISYIKQAAEKGMTEAKIILATLFMKGQSISEDNKEMIQHLSIMAIKGDQQAQYKLATLLRGFSLPIYDRVAFYWLEKAAGSNRLDIQFELAQFYEEGIGVAVNFNKAFALYQSVALKGHQPAFLALARLFYRGWGVDANQQQAEFWLRKAMQHDVAGAKVLAHEVFQHGFDFQMDRANSAQMFDFALESDVPSANYAQGKRLMEGDATLQKDINQAVFYFKKAAQQSFMMAQRELGIIFENGLVGKQNVDEAILWYQKAALQGDAFSQFRLAELYFHHHSELQDKIKAYAWANLAATAGMAPASELREIIYFQLTPNEIEQGQVLSLQYLNHYQNSDDFIMPVTNYEEDHNANIH